MKIKIESNYKQRHTPTMYSIMIKILEGFIDKTLAEHGEKFLPEALVNLTRAIEDGTMANILPTKTKIEVREGKYGRGVFATEDIPAGEILTLYPIHIHLTFMGDGKAEIVAQNDDMVYDESYSLTMKEGKSAIYGDKDKNHPVLLGHLFNDFCPFTEEFKTTKDVGGLCMKYMLYAKTYQQAQFKFFKHLVGIESRREIKKGEEIFVGYSPVYWIETVCQKEFANLLMEYLQKQPHSKKAFVAKTIQDYLSGI